MRLVQQHIINRNDTRYIAIDEMAFLSKNLYNATLYAVRQHFFNTGLYLPYATLQHQFQTEKQFDYYQLPTKVAQWTMKMVDQNFRSFFKALTAYKEKPSKFNGKPKIPKYLDKTKGRFLLTFTNQTISKRALQRDNVLKLSGIPDIEIPTTLSYNQINQVRIAKRVNCYVIEIIYTVPDVEMLEDNGRYASIDLGVNNLVTLVSNTNELTPIIYSGRKLKSINHYYNKKLSHYKSQLDKCNKKKSSKRISQLTCKRNNRIKDVLHKVSRCIVNQLIASNISVLVIGKNTKWKQDINIGSVNNQNFVQIPHNQLISLIRYKCALVGISVITTEESYTSKCSFLDLEKICKHNVYCGKRVKRGLFISKQGHYINADVNGAFNILRKCKPNAFADGVKGLVVIPKMLFNS